MAKKRFDVITVGNILEDISLFVSGGQAISTPNNLTAQRMIAFEYGAKLVSRDALFGWGGGASNVAVGLRRLGFRTAIFSRIGRDERGRAALANLASHRVATTLVESDPSLPTGLSFVLEIDRKDHDHVGFSHRGANSAIRVKTSQLSAVSTPWYYITSLSGEHWQDNLRSVFDQRGRGNARIAWNPGTTQIQAGKRVLADFLRQTDVLILNKDEAIELVLTGLKFGRRNPKHLNQPLYLLNILQEWGPKIVVITLGDKGAWAYDGKKVFRQSVIKAKKIVDTCGVGDAFGSGFLAGLMVTNDIARALRWGAQNASAAVRQAGAQRGLLTRREIEARRS